MEMTLALKTMSSREISDLVESRHDTVKVAIDRLVVKGVISKPSMADGKKSANGVIEQIYLICKRDSYIIVAQLSPEFTARLVDRWQELESAIAPAFTIPSTLSGALRLAAEQAEVIEAQTLQLIAAAPAIDFVDRYVDATGSKGFRQVAKLLIIKEHVFCDFLITQKIMYRLNSELTPHATHLDAGRFEVKAGKSDKNNHAFNSARFTPKGISWVAGEWAKHQILQSSH